MKRPLIIHHDNCPDGFGSAWLMAQSWKPGIAEIVGATFGEDLPADVDDRDVYVLDFSYELDQMWILADRASSVMVLDHHKTAFDRVPPIAYTIYGSVKEFQDGYGGYEGSRRAFAVLDMEHSGVGLTMQWCDKFVPFLHYIEDRDLWRFREGDATREVFAAVTSRPYTIEAWDKIEAMHLDDLRAEGRAINRYRNQLIEQTVDTAYQTEIAGYGDIWVAASPYAIGSDVAGILAERDPMRFAGYFVEYEHHRKWGLRSGPDGLDVTVIAKSVDPEGGGHHHAAGFKEWK